MNKHSSSLITRQDRETQAYSQGQGSSVFNESTLRDICDNNLKRLFIRMYKARGNSHGGVTETSQVAVIPFSLYLFNSKLLLNPCVTCIVFNKKLLMLCLCLYSLHVYINKLYTQPYHSYTFYAVCYTLYVVLIWV